MNFNESVAAQLVDQRTTIRKMRELSVMAQISAYIGATSQTCRRCGKHRFPHTVEVASVSDIRIVYSCDCAASMTRLDLAMLRRN